jgi:DMSO reductase anchor subunit
VAKAAPGVRLLPGAFESSYTKPTTDYRTRRKMPLNAQPADIYHLRLEQPHWPLICMLLLTQFAAGLTVALAVAAFLPGFAEVKRPLALAAFGALQAGLLLSVFHLGQPLKAWRFFLGLRTSWMSREILALGLFAGTSATATVVCLIDRLAPYAPMLAIAAAATALIGVYCSAMIYVDTWRHSWRALATFPKFFGTAAVLGLAGTAAILSYAPSALPFGAALLFTAWEALFFTYSLRHPAAPAHRSALAMWRLMRPLLSLRAGLMAAALVASCAAPPLLFFVLTFGAAVIERYCFFTASDAPRMPGGIA